MSRKYIWKWRLQNVGHVWYVLTLLMLKRPSYLELGYSHTWERRALYWDGPLAPYVTKTSATTPLIVQVKRICDFHGEDSNDLYHLSIDEQQKMENNILCLKMHSVRKGLISRAADAERALNGSDDWSLRAFSLYHREVL